MKRTLIISTGIIAIIVSGLPWAMSLKDIPAAGISNTENPASQNYRTYCAGCHGNNLEKFTAKKWMDEPDNASVIKSIKLGIETEGMPAFQNTFSEAEIAALAAYVKKGIPEDRSSLKPALKSGNLVKSEVQDFIVETIVSGLDVPWGLVFLPDGDLLISERSGRLHRFSNGKLSMPIQGLPPVRAKGQGGLLDLCLHPDYAENGWIYISYSALNQEKGNDVSNTAIMRAKLNGNKLVDQQVIFNGDPYTDKSHHYGSKLAFNDKKQLFFGIGDRGQHFDFPQDLGNTNGKIHRINDDGTIPDDNPFVKKKGAVPSIYSYGHRNPQGTCINPLTGEIWESEHGPRGGDELNLIVPGKNYGWPVISYGINYNGSILTKLTKKEGMEQPVHYWTPSIAPCGMTFLTGDKYKNWQNNLFIGSLSFEYLERVVINGHAVTHTEKLLEGIGRVRNVVIGPDGLIYVATETPGKILRLVPVNNE